MQDKHLFEYAIIRIVPRVEREEFMNVGVVLYAHKLKFLQCRFHLVKGRLAAFCPQLAASDVTSFLLAFDRIANGCRSSGAIGQLDAASRFRWLTAQRSTILQTSRVHPGFCKDPVQELDRLLAQYVL